ncbi:MAG TPA: EAL domain-containing protein [Candidatus Solibacter sp.]|jgi:diguanylate cyclase (GGDEF)-like protein|nr:EAL domain-containing protein [Candidatus Solibacter sp.]
MPLETGLASSSLTRRLRRAFGFLPHGRYLSDEDWNRRHRAIVALLWLQMVGLVAFGLWRGYSWTHVVVDGGAVTVFAAWATQPYGGRRLRSSLASLGLLTGSALGVHLSGGVIEAHFMYFVVIALLMLYQDWIPFLVAIAFVVGEHGLIGVLLPTSVYNHGAAQKDPWLWAGIHGSFVLAASAANLAYWRFSETDHARATLMLHQAARVDGLTGAVNRRGWDERINQVLNLARRPGLSIAVAILDFDDFKSFNDSWGHQRGDQLLQRSVAAWRTALREEDLLARYGGDEFSLILPGCDLHGAITVLERVVQLTPESQSCSVGVAIWNGSESSGELIARVDEALYEGKKHKHVDDRRIYVAKSAAGGGSTGAWADRIPRLVENGDIVSVYQPIVDLGSASLVAYEAFPRPTDDPSSESDAGMFEAAKRMGYLRDLEWICRRAALEGGTADSRHLPLFVKMSVALLVDPLHDVDQLLLLARAAERSPGQVVIEIAEQDDSTELDQLVAAVTSHREAGFRFAIDQFGGGRSTLEVLVAVNPEFIKIAGSLTAAAESPVSRAAIQAIITFAQAQGATVVAQGVDSEWQRSLLREQGVTLGQGDLFGPPAPHVREAPALQQTPEVPESARRVPLQRPAPGVS